MAKTRMTSENTHRFLVHIQRMAKPGESLEDATERLAVALERCGFRGYIQTVAIGDMDPVTADGGAFGQPDDDQDD